MADCMPHAHPSPCPHCVAEAQEYRELNNRRRRLMYVIFFVIALYAATGVLMYRAGWPPEFSNPQHKAQTND